jgi:hypothetical protein
VGDAATNAALAKAQSEIGWRPIGADLARLALPICLAEGSIRYPSQFGFVWLLRI